MTSDHFKSNLDYNLRVVPLKADSWPRRREKHIFLKTFSKAICILTWDDLIKKQICQNWHYQFLLFFQFKT